MNLNNFLIFLIVFLKMNSVLTPDYQNRWVVWNIGQGQWVTHILVDECRHFDMGGEFGSFQRIRRSLLSVCGAKKNKIFLSHWDYDHYFNISSAARHLPNLCWQKQPQFAKTKVSAQKVLDLGLPNCSERLADPNQIWEPHFAKNTNESSAVILEQKVLIPGDSPISEEKFWIQEMQNLNAVKVLIIGHHGSHTSTGHELLASLTGLKYAVASARNQKYRHPHKDTVKRIYESLIPILKTEDWGNIWFEIRNGL